MNKWVNHLGIMLSQSYLQAVTVTVGAGLCFF